MQLTDKSILDELKASGNLPSPTGVALTLLELARDLNADTDDMAEVLQGDPALTGQILKYANRADMGTRGEIIAIRSALVRLGMRTVRQLCLGFSVLSNARSGPCLAFDYPRYWARSLAMAVGCQAISKLVPSIQPDEGFTCGLLAHIGRLALASVYPEEYATILTRWSRGTMDELAALERECVGLTHADAGVALLDDWGIPEHVVEATRYQEDGSWVIDTGPQPVPGRRRQLGRVLYAASLAADICIEDTPRRHLMVMDFLKVGEAFGISEESWVTMYDEILDEWARMGKVLDVMTSMVPSMEQLVKHARSHDATVEERRRPVPFSAEDTKPRKTGPAAGTDEKTDTEAIGLPEDSAATDGLDILVVTDSALDMKILTRKLTEHGHRVTSAEDGHQALETALKTAPDLILSDWVLPGKDGLELCRMLRSSPQTNHIYYIITTSNDTNDELVEGFAAGINDYLVKPINHQILEARLRGAAQVIHLREQNLRDREELRLHMSHVNKLNRQLETMALEDQLTQLPNRRAGLDALERIWTKSESTGECMLAMILDIDHFKNVNDTYGHDAGDVVLHLTAQVMKTTMRDYDSVCRYGGEEFLIVCPGADLAVAKDVGNRIRTAIENNVIDTPEFKGNITVSIGVAVKNDGHTSTKDLLKEADEALYAAKDAGRNKVCIHAV